MNRRLVRGDADQAVEGIDLADQMSLAESPDRRVAGHRADLGRIEGDQRHLRAEPRRRGRRLDSGMAAAHHDDIKFVHGRALGGQRSGRKTVSRETGLFADAEPAEQRVEHILHPRPARDPVQRRAG